MGGLQKNLHNIRYLYKLQFKRAKIRTLDLRNFEIFLAKFRNYLVW